MSCQRCEQIRDGRCTYPGCGDPAAPGVIKCRRHHSSGALPRKVALARCKHPSLPERELRRVNAGSTYWVRKVAGLAGAQWVLTADGTVISGPCDYQTAVAGLDAVAPLEES